VTPGCKSRSPDASLSTAARSKEHLTVTPGCRPRAPDAKARRRCLENRLWACRTRIGFRTLKKKPFAWVSKGALGTKLARPSAQDCLPLYLEVK